MRLKIFLFLLVFLVIQVPPSSGSDCPGVTRPLYPVAGYQQLPVGATAVGLTIPAGAIQMAVAMVETDAIRYRDDGTDLTSTVGTPVQINVPITICRGSLSKFKAIRVTTNATLNILYYRQ